MKTRFSFLAALPQESHQLSDASLIYLACYSRAMCNVAKVKMKDFLVASSVPSYFKTYIL